MTGESLKRVIENLLEQESAEKKLISLYLVLLDAGVENCLPASEQPAFRYDLNLLLEQSRKHLGMIKLLLEKHHE